MDRSQLNQMRRASVTLIFYLLMPWCADGEETAKQNQSTGKAEINVGQIELPPGFFAEQIYKVPRKTQGSWVALTIDPQGRLIASAQSRGLFRITPPPTGSRKPAHD